MAKQSTTNGKSIVATTARRSKQITKQTTKLLQAVTTHIHTDVRIRAVSFFDDCFGVHCSDGRMIAIPYWWFPRLAEASEEQRLQYAIRRESTALWWDDIDEVLHLDGILEGKVDISHSAAEWRKDHGYEWFDRWYYHHRLTEEQRRTMEERSTRWAASDFAKQQAEEEMPQVVLMRGADVIDILADRYNIKLSKQRLHQLTHGETQRRKGKEYRIEPHLRVGEDFYIVKKKVRYTNNSLKKLADSYRNIAI